MEPLNAASARTTREKTLLHLVFVYFGLQILPLDSAFFATLRTADWSRLHYQDLFVLTTFSARPVPGENLPLWGIGSYQNWLIIFLIAVAAALIWNKRSIRTDDRVLYYWLRVGVRYRLALGVTGYAFLKIFSVQLPGPTLSDYHTAYGEFLPWKIYNLTVGVGAAGYERSLGLLELAGAALLFFRRTTFFGAALIAAIYINVVAVNFAYDLGDHVYGAYLLSLALFLVAHDTPRLFRLLVLKKKAQADRFIPDFSEAGPVRLVVKSIPIFFLLVYAAATFVGTRLSAWPFPDTPGLTGSYGYYEVTAFRLNGKVHPYSLTDPVRWQNVVFERWNSLSIRTARPAPLDVSVAGLGFVPDARRTYEAAGNSGRAFFRYTHDAPSHTLVLRSEQEASQYYRLRYERPAKDILLLHGVGPGGDRLEVALKRIDRKYLLEEGRRRPISIY